MATAKEQLLEFIKNLPDDLSPGELEREVVQNMQFAHHVRALVERGERDIDEGRTISHEDLKKKRGLG